MMILIKQINTNMKIHDIITETTSAGSIATVVAPLGGMIKRPSPSIYKSKKKKVKKKNESSKNKT